LPRGGADGRPVPSLCHSGPVVAIAHLRRYRNDKDAVTGVPLLALDAVQVAGRDLAVAPILELVGDLLALGEAGKPGLLDSADVDEGVLASIVGLDEAEAFSGAEEFAVP
jgi:hypothetical protein